MIQNLGYNFKKNQQKNPARYYMQTFRYKSLTKPTVSHSSTGTIPVELKDPSTGTIPIERKDPSTGTIPVERKDPSSHGRPLKDVAAGSREHRWFCE